MWSLIKRRMPGVALGCLALGVCWRHGYVSGERDALTRALRFVGA